MRPGQYAWLLNNALTSWQDHKSWGLAGDDISDKNKADGLVKLAALVQLVWFTLQCVTRAAHQLPLATIETMALAYVFKRARHLGILVGEAKGYRYGLFR